jgi:hypothetical protein
MSEIQVVPDYYWFRWIVVGLIGVVSSLGIYIFRAIKKDIEENKKAQIKDHERLNTLEAEHKVFHKDETGIK